MMVKVNNNGVNKISQQKGFTLLEILLALFIFAILALIVTGSLHTVLQAHVRDERAAEQLQELQIALTLLQNDLQQMIDRSVLDESGDTQAAFIASASSLEFTRAGFINPLATERRSTLQRVAYSLVGKDLVRQVWGEHGDILDRFNTTEPVQRIVLSGVTSFKFRFMGMDNQFYNSWPTPVPLSASSAQVQAGIPLRTLPHAVEVTLVLPWGTLTRIFVITGVGLAVPPPVEQPS